MREPASGSNLTQGAGNRLGRQVFNARDPKRRPFRNRPNMRDSRKEAAGEKETAGARDHSASSIFAIILSAFCRRSSMYASTAASRISLSKLRSSAFETIIATILR